MPEVKYILDADSTLLTKESLDALSHIALESRPDREFVVAEIGRITTLGMERKLAFDESLRQRLALFNAHRDDVEAVTTLLRGSISPSANARRAWFAENVDQIFVVSGGFEDYLTPVLSEGLGIRPDHIYANAFTFGGDGMITGFDATRLVSQPGGKAKQVAKLGLVGPVVSIGDGSNDLEIREQGAADEFWAFTETIHRAAVVANADRVLVDFHEDLSWDYEDRKELAA